MVGYAPSKKAKGEANLHGDHIPVVFMPRKPAKNGLINYLVCKHSFMLFGQTIYNLKILKKYQKI